MYIGVAAAAEVLVALRLSLCGGVNDVYQRLRHQPYLCFYKWPGQFPGVQTATQSHRVRGLRYYSTSCSSDSEIPIGFVLEKIVIKYGQVILVLRRHSVSVLVIIDRPNKC